MCLSYIKITESVPTYQAVLIQIVVFLAIFSSASCQCCLKEQDNGRGCLQCSAGMTLVKKNCIRKIENCGIQQDLQCLVCRKNYFANQNKTRCLQSQNARIRIIGFAQLSQQLSQTPKFKALLDSIKKYEELKIPSLTLIRKFIANKDQQNPFPTSDIINPIILRLVYFFQKGIIERTYQYSPPIPQQNISQTLLPETKLSKDYFLRAGEISIFNGGKNQTNTIQTLLQSKDYLQLRGSDIIDIFQIIEKRSEDNKPLYYNNRVLYLPTLNSLIVQKTIPSTLDIEVNQLSLNINPKFSSTGATQQKKPNIMNQPINSTKIYIQAIAQLQRTQPYQSYLSGSRMINFQQVEGSLEQGNNTSYIGNVYNVTFVHPNILNQEGKALISYILFKVQTNDRVKVIKSYFLKKEKPASSPLNVFQKAKNIAETALENNNSTSEKVAFQFRPSTTTNTTSLSNIISPNLQNISGQQQQIPQQTSDNNKLSPLNLSKVKSNTIDPDRQIAFMQEEVNKVQIFEKEIFKKIRQQYLQKMLGETKGQKKLIRISSGSNLTFTLVQIMYYIFGEDDQRYWFMTFSVNTDTKVTKLIKKHILVIQDQQAVNTNKYLEYNMTILNQQQQELDKIDKYIKQILKIIKQTKYYQQIVNSTSKIQLVKLTVYEFRDNISPFFPNNIVDMKRYIFRFYTDPQQADYQFQFVEFRYDLVFGSASPLPRVLFRKEKYSDIGDLPRSRSREINQTRRAIIRMVKNYFPQDMFQIQAIFKSEDRNQVYRVFVLFDNKRYKFEVSKPYFFPPFLYSVKNITNMSPPTRLLLKSLGDSYYYQDKLSTKNPNKDKNKHSILQQKAQTQLGHRDMRWVSNLRKNDEETKNIFKIKQTEYAKIRIKSSQISLEKPILDSVTIRNCLIQFHKTCIVCKFGYTLAQENLPTQSEENGNKERLQEQTKPSRCKQIVSSWKKIKIRKIQK